MINDCFVRMKFIGDGIDKWSKNNGLDRDRADNETRHDSTSFAGFGFRSLCNSIRRIPRDITVCIVVPFNVLDHPRSSTETRLQPAVPTPDTVRVPPRPKASN